jgi:cell division protein FtsB
MDDFSVLKKLAQDANEQFPALEDQWSMVCTPSVGLELLAEIERLRTAEGDAMTYKAGMENVAQRRDQLKAENNKLKTVCGAFDRVNTKLKAENEALRKDAGRYLWMRNWYIEERPRADINPWGHVMVTTPLVLDACIDAAMAK